MLGCRMPAGRKHTVCFSLLPPAALNLLKEPRTILWMENPEEKDTCALLQSEIQWPESSAQGRKLELWAGRGSHGVQSVDRAKKHKHIIHKLYNYNIPDLQNNIIATE